MESLSTGIALLFTVKGGAFLILGFAVGYLLRSLPRLGAASALALLIPFSFALTAFDALVMAGGALGAVVFGEGITGIAAAILSLPVLAAVSLFASWAAPAFGPPELFLLAVLTVVACAAWRGAHGLRALFAGILGLLFSIVGNPGSGQGIMPGGIGLLPALVGLLLLAPLLALSVEGNSARPTPEKSFRLPRLAGGGDAASLIPLLALGIPAGAAGAVLVAYLVLHGAPGPLPAVGDSVAVSVLLPALAVGGIVAGLIGLSGFRPETLLWRMDIHVAVPSLTALSLAGVQVSGGRVGDMIVAVGFGILGYFMIGRHYSRAVMAVGLVLGVQAAGSFNSSMESAGGGWQIFFRPGLSLALLALLAVSLVIVIFGYFRQDGIAPRARGEAQPNRAKLVYASVIWSCIALVLALVFGTVIGLAAYVFGYVLMQSGRSLLQSALASLAVVLAAWIGFELLLGQVLYRGLIVAG